MPKYAVEVTDTFGGEPNYSYVDRYVIEAKSFLGAVRKVGRRESLKLRYAYDVGDAARYDAVDDPICVFIEEKED